MPVMKAAKVAQNIDAAAENDDDAKSFFSSSDGESENDADVKIPETSGSPGLELLEVIGHGAHGTVYKAMWKGSVAAVKIIEHHAEDELDSDDDVFDHLVEDDRNAGRGGAPRTTDLAVLEAAVSSTVFHPNVVQTYDYHTVSSPIGMSTFEQVNTVRETRIVMEYCDLQSLEHAIIEGAFQKQGQNAMDYEAICLTLIEIASAIQYLHRLGITHRDLKPKNILLKTSKADKRGFTSKVSDFGLSKLWSDTVDSGPAAQEQNGTVTHMSPELLSEGTILPAADVYAFGIIIWEVYTGETPYGGMNKMQIIVGVASDDMRPEFPRSCPDWLSSLAIQCWSANPDDRPTLADIVARLKDQLALLHAEEAS